jgi:hypothetical protein
MIKQTRKISKMFVKIFNDLGKAEIQISFFFNSSSGAPPVENQKMILH